MSGYQPTSDKDFDNLEHTWISILVAIFIPGWLIGFPIMRPDDMTLSAAIIISVICLPLLGIAITGVGNVLAFIHDITRTIRYNIKKEKFDKKTDLENWIDSCRK